MTLLDLPIGQNARIRELAILEPQKGALYALGMTQGAWIKKLQETTKHGPILVCTQQRCNIALGRDIAEKIELS